ncbi:hypothetical protein CEXT_337921 [Caerostris extrusa]|uniref:Uncharacterized protein n=1 Tax=Caerostris extrusa TaxID=172846 RepID=A0AAV4W627_CAEEX|nr:hypothetical protein CEXT_337921 [Caerostris extrusa]
MDGFDEVDHHCLVTLCASSEIVFWFLRFRGGINVVKEIEFWDVWQESPSIASVEVFGGKKSMISISASCDPEIYLVGICDFSKLLLFELPSGEIGNNFRLCSRNRVLDKIVQEWRQ